MYEDDLQLGTEIIGKLFATQALSQTQIRSPEIRRLRVRFPSEAQKHFSEFAIKLE